MRQTSWFVSKVHIIYVTVRREPARTQIIKSKWSEANQLEAFQFEVLYIGGFSTVQCLEFA